MKIRIYSENTQHTGHLARNTHITDDTTPFYEYVHNGVGYRIVSYFITLGVIARLHRFATDAKHGGDANYVPTATLVRDTLTRIHTDTGLIGGDLIAFVNAVNPRKSDNAFAETSPTYAKLASATRAAQTA